MTFLNPLYLFGLLAAGIPIVIHLLTRKRPTRIPFSSVEFLREVNTAQAKSKFAPASDASEERFSSSPESSDSPSDFRA